MATKISISIKARNPKQRDQFLKKLRDVLLTCPGLEGSIKTTKSVDIIGGEELDIMSLGLGEDAPETPLERAINGRSITPTP